MWKKTGKNDRSVEDRTLNTAETEDKMKFLFRAIVCSMLLTCALRAEGTKRIIIDLNGTWDIAEGTMESVPGHFDRRIPVPGLVDMTEPEFQGVGFTMEQRQAFWYHRTFEIPGDLPDHAILKINKAKFGIRVYVNGTVAGEHMPCFTPALLDVRHLLKGNGGQNDILIRVGADTSAVPEHVPFGWDFEKYRFIPGIYDDVELILADSPFIVNVQTVPDIEHSRLRIVTELKSRADLENAEILYRIREVRTGSVVTEKTQKIAVASEEKVRRADFELSIPACHLWSPEDPFLYELTIETAGDLYTTRFGMRSFRFDPVSGRALLNGKPYFMRGTNVCIFRFFEDANRNNKPWDKHWVQRLHRQFKYMHWNSIRYCIGFPPECWYEIADEEGFLIQDEYPIWYLSPDTKKMLPTISQLEIEYTEWMRKRWNHPCVVIWDAQNESVTPKTGEAIKVVRDLDLSDRPWDNGWAMPDRKTDCTETHPYYFSPWNSWVREENIDFRGIMPRLFEEFRYPRNGPQDRADEGVKVDNAVIINEYGWLWLNRDGTPTRIDRSAYEKLLGPVIPISQARYLYARYLAALTEYWRSSRICAGVLHFCGLGYSRPGVTPDSEYAGATSDNFIDIDALNYEMYFERYVRDAFAPVGIMLHIWDGDYTAGSSQRIPVNIINDLYTEWRGSVELYLVKDNRTVKLDIQNVDVGALERKEMTFDVRFPEEGGEYQLFASLRSEGSDESVNSVRDIKIVND